MPLDESRPCLVAFTIFESCLRAYVVPARFGSMPSAVLLFPSVRARARQTMRRFIGHWRRTGGPTLQWVDKSAWHCVERNDIDGAVLLISFTRAKIVR